MTGKFHAHGEQNRTYQRDMAKALLECLGCADALEFCQQYGWEGVIRHVLNWSRRDDYAEESRRLTG